MNYSPFRYLIVFNTFLYMIQPNHQIGIYPMRTKLIFNCRSGRYVVDRYNYVYVKLADFLTTRVPETTGMIAEYIVCPRLNFRRLNDVVRVVGDVEEDVFGNQFV